jgi:uncharacterized peroxidase-related enzyme
MAFVELVQDEQLPAQVVADAQALGYVPNYMRAFAHRPAALAAWQQLVAAIKGSMDERRYELATLAAARRMRSSYCCLAHGRILAEKFFSADEVAGIAKGAHELDEVDSAVMDFAAAIAADASAITGADVDRLREVGLTDEEIVDVALAAAARAFFTKTLDSLGVQPDAVFRSIDPELREALTVGRPIAD